MATKSFKPLQLQLDPRIAPLVHLLRHEGIETFESCEGGEGHAFSEPTIRFKGIKSEGFRAYAIATYHGFSVFSLRRVWDVNDGELTGPHWEMTFILPTSSPNG